jgi:hypothetical protein
MTCASGATRDATQFEREYSLAEKGSCPHTKLLLTYGRNAGRSLPTLRSFVAGLARCGVRQTFLNNQMCPKGNAPEFVVVAQRSEHDPDTRPWMLELRCRSDEPAVITPREAERSLLPWYGKGEVGGPNTPESIEFKASADPGLPAVSITIQCGLLATQPRPKSLALAVTHLRLSL